MQKLGIGTKHKASDQSSSIKSSSSSLKYFLRNLFDMYVVDAVIAFPGS